jgi:hypothetical protein
MGEKVLSRLERRSRELGEPKSRVAERLIDEGLRMEEFPGIIFRDGPSGRRAALLDGPDAWEVIADLQRAKQRKKVDPVKAVVRGSGLSEQHVRLAAAYYGRYPDEIDARIERNEELHEAAERTLAKLGA